MTQQIPNATVVEFKRPNESATDRSPTPEPEVTAWERPLVLLASRDPSVRQWGGRWLEREGLATSLVTSDAEAMSRLQDQRPAVAIIEAGLRAGDGARLYEVLKQHETLAATPILVLCANDKETRRALEAEVTDVARRPVDWQILSRRAALLSRSFRAMAPHPPLSSVSRAGSRSGLAIQNLSGASSSDTLSTTGISSMALTPSS